ncbi:hypothetical protein HanPSC8_Chr05g0196021 [Helianthus annuus]|nr:hypothetical protein HanPSC8_Chr05g0196021 [Helianthus annuus]
MLHRVPVLRCKTIINRNNNRSHLSRHPAAHHVVLLNVGGQESEPTTVKVKDERDILYRVFCGDKYSEPEVASWVHDDVVCLDAVDWFGLRWDAEEKEVEKTAVDGAVWSYSCISYGVK